MRGNWTGLPELAGVFNVGFNVLKGKDVEYVLVSGADGVYPPNYVEEITNSMEKENVVLASGVLEGKISQSFGPRACGRVINAECFRQIGFKYPLNCAFEGYLVYKAFSQSKNVAVFPELKFKLFREPDFVEESLSEFTAEKRFSNILFLSYCYPNLVILHVSILLEQVVENKLCYAISPSKADYAGQSNK